MSRSEPKPLTAPPKVPQPDKTVKPVKTKSIINNLIFNYSRQNYMLPIKLLFFIHYRRTIFFLGTQIA